MIKIKLNQKGFMFIETIVMCAILMTGLLLVYKQYTSGILVRQERLKYDPIANDFRMHYIRDYIVKNHIKENESDILVPLGDLGGFGTAFDIQIIYKGKPNDLLNCDLNCDLDGDQICDINCDLDGDGICDANCDQSNDLPDLKRYIKTVKIDDTSIEYYVVKFNDDTYGSIRVQETSQI